MQKTVVVVGGVESHWQLYCLFFLGSPQTQSHCGPLKVAQDAHAAPSVISDVAHRRPDTARKPTCTTTVPKSKAEDAAFTVRKAQLSGIKGILSDAQMGFTGIPTKPRAL